MDPRGPRSSRPRPGSDTGVPAKAARNWGVEDSLGFSSLLVIPILLILLEDGGGHVGRVGEALEVLVLLLDVCQDRSRVGVPF